jgi:hypothetical protein
MLELPDDWQNITTGYVLRDLLLQANAIGSYPEAARACVKAAIDFMLAGPRWKKHDPPVKVISSASGWQLNDWLFHVMPGADDDAFQAIDDLPSVMGDIDVLAPPWSESVIRYAAKSAYPKRRIQVLGVDGFCELRLMWTRLDMNCQHAESIADFLERYRILTKANEKITIQPVPREGTKMGKE